MLGLNLFNFSNNTVHKIIHLKIEKSFVHNILARVKCIKWFTGTDSRTRASPHSHTRPLIVNHSFFLLHTTQLFDFSLLRSFPPPHSRASNAANNHQKEKKNESENLCKWENYVCDNHHRKEAKINREMRENQRRKKANKNSDQLIIHRASFAFISSLFLSVSSFFLFQFSFHFPLLLLCMRFARADWKSHLYINITHIHRAEQWYPHFSFAHTWMTHFSLSLSLWRRLFSRS